MIFLQRWPAWKFPVIQLMHKLPLLQQLRARPRFRLLQGHQIWAQIPLLSPGQLLVPILGHSPHFQCSSWLKLQLTSKSGF